MRRSEHIRKYPQRYNPGFGAAREWKNDAVASIVYIIQDGDFNSNVDTDDILSLLDDWDAEYCMDTPSTFHMREYYVIKSQSHNPDTPTYVGGPPQDSDFFLHALKINFSVYNASMEYKLLVKNILKKNNMSLVFIL